MSDTMEDDEQSPGAPAWMATFADLMSLLMCFFVLLLSFSEMDLQKYKQVAGSMAYAFGVQNKVKVMDIPKGTSIIAKEFSPGKPEPTQIKTVNQFTTETTKPSLSVGNPSAPKSAARELNEEETERLLREKLEALIAETEEDADKLRDLLEEDVNDGKIDIESNGRSITIRIRERGSFPSASANLSPEFVPVMNSLRNALTSIDGLISIEGHTDNIPIRTAAFESNWDLSASRALSVTHELIKSNTLDPNRFMVVGRADTQPFKPNDSAQERAQNRRVEIIIRQGLDEQLTTDIKKLQRGFDDLLQGIDLNSAG
ncbi:flagellar motor protein MotB [Pseudohalioglobus lutimaris]|uniref:Type VI secretion system protein TssL n=1 Tax=Pseudohalioglobus lutimaris TaxID=1737061 RepID=A0A2N5X1F5_9GAMM|nr:flagellar motor protein MotB [Pseudohalioglobus lutimaris]PLW68315.1 type VI secretion system protein TssL [Pseudohalioglobus lutimaris]